MVRKAAVKDAVQLGALNDEFNGAGETTVDNIRNSLMYNQQEVVIVDDENGVLTGFVCVQLKKSFCYDEYMPEITECSDTDSVLSFTVEVVLLLSVSVILIPCCVVSFTTLLLFVLPADFFLSAHPFTKKTIAIAIIITTAINAACVNLRLLSRSFLDNLLLLIVLSLLISYIRMVLLC